MLMGSFNGVNHVGIGASFIDVERKCRGASSSANIKVYVKLVRVQQLYESRKAERKDKQIESLFDDLQLAPS